jgi:hypothetical protein
LWNWKVEYQEEYDFNESDDFPNFDRTNELKNNNYKVKANTHMTVLEATSQYPILTIPENRSFNNLFIKYILTYSTDPE